MATHDFGHLCSVGWAADRGVDDLGRLTEIRRTYRRRRDYAESLGFLDPLVIKPVNGAARNT